MLGLGRSPGEGNGYPLQYSGLENSPWGRKELYTTERSGKKKRRHKLSISEIKLDITMDPSDIKRITGYINIQTTLHPQITQF